MSDHTAAGAEIWRTVLIDGKIRLLPLPPERYGDAYGPNLLGLVVNDLVYFAGQRGMHLSPAELIEIVRVAEAVERLMDLPEKP